MDELSTVALHYTYTITTLDTLHHESASQHSAFTYCTALHYTTPLQYCTTLLYWTALLYTTAPHCTALTCGLRDVNVTGHGVQTRELGGGSSGHGAEGAVAEGEEGEELAGENLAAGRPGTRAAGEKIVRE
jgi:hypothetical protein